jgi:pimeloyl-ACP methyl ester carboxylesterase
MAHLHLTGKCASALYILSLLILAGCGDGSSSDPKPTLLSGAVIDGYIEGAKVCLDQNSNGACDAGEPSSTTNSLGKYELDIGYLGTTGLMLIAEIPNTAKDADDGGKTLAEAGKKAYTLSGLAETPAVITPLTTLMTDEVMTNKLSLAQAQAKVLMQMGLPDTTNPQEDHVAKNNLQVQEAAKLVALQLQQLQSNVASGATASQRWTQVQEARRTAQAQAGSVSKTASSALNMPAVLSNVANGSLFSYRMTSAKGLPIKASAMLFTPKEAAPAGGWPLVVFGHGTVGVGQQCAPSVTMNSTGLWEYADLVASLIANKIAVVAPDYEGLGSADMEVAPGHPYLDLRSAGHSMVLAAVAAKKSQGSKLSGAWAALGHSQGGHAALAAAQYADLARSLDASLAYKGAVAVAPASNLQASLNAFASVVNGATTPDKYVAGYGAVTNTSFYAAYVLKGTESTSEPVAAASLLRNNMQEIYKFVANECIGAFTKRIIDDQFPYISTSTKPSDYPGVNYPAINSAFFTRRLLATEPALVKLPGKTLIIQGAADTTVLPDITRLLKTNMLSKGSDVTLSEFTGDSATHSGVLKVPLAQSAMKNFLDGLFLPAVASAAP